MNTAEESRPFEPKATVYGLTQIGLLIELFAALSYHDQIIEFFSKAIYGIVNLGLIFYGQNLVKRLNRNYVGWAAALFLFTPVALIILGRLRRLPAPAIVLDFDTGTTQQNVNNLPPIKLVTASPVLQDALANDTFTLRHLISDYDNSIKEYGGLFPVAAAYELNRRNHQLDEAEKAKLHQFARECGRTDFPQLLENIRNMSPEEMTVQFT
jgi:hypothetical protein